MKTNALIYAGIFTLFCNIFGATQLEKYLNYLANLSTEEFEELAQNPERIQRIEEFLRNHQKAVHRFIEQREFKKPQK